MRERPYSKMHIKANASTNKPIGTMKNVVFTKALSLDEKGDKMIANVFKVV